MAIKRKLAVGLLAAVPVLAGCDAETTTAPGLEMKVHSLLGGLEPGETYLLSGADAASIPLFGGANGAEYLVVPFYLANTSDELDLAIRGQGAAASAPLLAHAPEPAGEPRRMLGRETAVGAFGSGSDFGQSIAASHRAHEQLRTRMRRETSELMRRGAANPVRLRTSVAAAPAHKLFTNAAIGDEVSINVQTDMACEDPKYRTGKVVAISKHAILVADEQNPAGGFDESHYRAFAAEFDGLVHPVVTRTFGEPTDIDGNGKVVIFFTSAVNDLTPPGSRGTIVGFFYARDLFPKSGSVECEGSNEAEMFYIMAPDPERAKEEPLFSVENVEYLAMGVIAHEYQHLINAARRIYVNNADALEEVWLDEALSHVAEELVFYEAAGMGPRRDIDLDDIFASDTRLNAVNKYMIDNLAKYGIFLEEVEGASVFDHDLAGRGASWAFIRYVADRSGKSDADFFYELVNSTLTGRTNVSRAAGESMEELTRDWSVSVFTDNYVLGLPDRYRQPSWDFRSLLPAINVFGGKFPLSYRTFNADRAENVPLRGGGTAFVRVPVDAASRALLETTKHGGGTPPDGLLMTVLRIR